MTDDAKLTEPRASLFPPGQGVHSQEAHNIGREGLVTVWDDQGRYLGCMGRSVWEEGLAAEAALAEARQERDYWRNEYEKIAEEVAK